MNVTSPSSRLNRSGRSALFDSVLISGRHFTAMRTVRWRQDLAPVTQQLLQDVRGAAELSEFRFGEASEKVGQIFDAALARLLQKAGAFGGGANLHAAGIVRIAGDFNQAAALESGDHAAHGGRPDLLG